MKNQSQIRIREFCNYLRNIKGNSKNTIDSYKLDLTMLYRYLALQVSDNVDNIEFEDIDISCIDDDTLKSITLDDLYDYIQYSKDILGNENATIGRKISSTQMFFRFLHTKKKVLENDPSVELEKPKLGKRNPKYLNLEECSKLIKNTSGRNGTRDKLLLLMFLNCGMRLAELCNIKMNDIKDDTIRIIGKGNKERFVYLNETCMRALEDYKVVREQTIIKSHSKRTTSSKASEYLFLSERGSNLARRSVQHVVEARLKGAGLNNLGYSTHKLRHTAATLLYRNDIDILVIKEILGHESVSTTQIYTHTDNERIRAAVKSNPLNI